MIKKFGGINLYAGDIQKSIHFYKNILCVPVLSHAEDGIDGMEFGFIENGPRFWIWDAVKWSASCKFSVNLVFYADDLDQTWNSLKENGVDCKPPFTAIWGGRELEVFDPDGNKLTILDL